MAVQELPPLPRLRVVGPPWLALKRCAALQPGDEILQVNGEAKGIQ